MYLWHWAFHGLSRSVRRRHGCNRGRRDLNLPNQIETLHSVWDGISNQFLGLEIERNSNGDVLISQGHYLKRILKWLGIEDCKPDYTPLEPGTHFRRRHHNLAEPDESAEPTLYQEIIGSINHLAVWSRPDIANTVSKLARYIHDPSVEHMAAAKCLLWYIQSPWRWDLPMVNTSPCPCQFHGFSNWNAL